MREEDCRTLKEALLELEKVSPGVPLLALGQTVFWDEPMKAGVAQTLARMGSKRRLVAGIHDTDYFAKLPLGVPQAGKFRAFPHNDTTTKGLWSAAGEFSALFGSETVVTRDIYQQAGLRVSPILKSRPKFLDEATEAFGWRGIVSLDDSPPVTAEVPTAQIIRELKATLDWALESSLNCLSGEGREIAEVLAEDLRKAISNAVEAGEPRQTVSELYRSLVPTLYEFAANAPVDIDTTATTELLRLNQQTLGLRRFDLVRLFFDPSTRSLAKEAYNQAIAGSPGLYPLPRFGTGAIPFDLVIPGEGRGTIRLGTRGAVISTPKPQFLSFDKPLTSLEQFADAVERKFGPNCVLVGKAVTLIGMLAREFAFVFHDGASSYVRYSRRLHDRLSDALGEPFRVHPILRIRYDSWESLRVACAWLKLPEPMHRAFGTEELCAPSFAERYREVALEQEQFLAELGKLRRPIDLIRFLDEKVGGQWQSQAREYESLRGGLEVMEREQQKARAELLSLYDRLRTLKAERVSAEHERGIQWRAEIWDKSPDAAALERRSALIARVDETIRAIEACQTEIWKLRKRCHELTKDPAVQRIHERRRTIELEVELKRARLIRNAIISGRGLQYAGRRPSAWWFRLVCPDGLWFRETIESARAWLEPMNSPQPSK